MWKRFITLTDDLRNKENLIYWGLWAIIVLLYVLHVVSEHSDNPDVTFTVRDGVRMANTLLPLIALFVINNYVLIPRLLWRHRLGWYVAASLVAVALVATWQYLSHIHGRPPMFDGLWAEDSELHKAFIRRHRPHFVPMPFVHDLVNTILVVGGNLAIALISRQMKFNFEREQLLAANMENRLQQLKTQINPHFYMNMLNNIHGLIELDPPKAQDMVVDMSQLMRYMLYDSSQPHISLGAEIKFLSDYLRLMRQRFPADKVTVTSDFPDENVMAGIQVPPLLFLVFIENAFKHGVSYRRPSFVAISLEVSSDRRHLHFTCINSTLPPGSGQTAPDRNGGGIGLKNVRQRLSLIYGAEASLQIQETTASYTVNLTIPIHDTPDKDPHNR